MEVEVVKGEEEKRKSQGENKNDGRQDGGGTKPRNKVKVNGRTVEFEQKVECGRGCTAVYSAI